MSAFFESEIIKDALDDINKLQEDVYGKLVHFHMMTYDEQIDHVSKLTELLDKQRIMYTRLSLSDDPEAIDLLNTMKSSFTMMGFPVDMNVSSFFDEARKTIETLRVSIDK